MMTDLKREMRIDITQSIAIMRQCGEPISPLIAIEDGSRPDQRIAKVHNLFEEDND